MVKIAFALPVPNMKIIGGYKVVYEYANYLVEQGFDVAIVYNAHDGDNLKHLPRRLVYLIRWEIGTFGPRWFKLDNRISKVVCPHFTEHTFQRYNVVIATAVETAKFVNFASQKKFYFVQDFENWGRTAEEVFATYRMDMEIITVSKWLKKIIDEVSDKEAVYIPNGIDKKIFHVEIPYEKRGIHTLSTLWHWDQRKGCDVTLNVINKLKDRYSDLEVFMFGAPKRKRNWPKWIHYVQKASPLEVSKLMNCARVFLCTSRQEGFGLTGLESIFCGCILVSTDCKGVREYATEENSYLCSVDDEETIFESVCDAFENRSKRSEKGKMYSEIMHRFDIEESKRRFCSVIS